MKSTIITVVFLTASKETYLVKRSAIAFFLAVALCVPAFASAHSLYIQAARYHVSKGKGSPLFFCYGHHIPVDDAIRREKLHSVQVFAPNGTVGDVALRDEKSLHSYVITYDAPGTYVLTAETTPGYFTMWQDKKGRKRHTIGPMSRIADQASEIMSSLRSSQWTKTYVACEAPSEIFPAFVGMPLELVPGQDVSLVKKGDTLEMQVYMDGKPYTGPGFWDATYNGFSTQAEDMYVPRSEISGGRISLPVDQTGRWFVRFYTKTPAPEADRSEYLQEKRTATLVFEVPNARKGPEIDSH